MTAETKRLTRRKKSKKSLKITKYVRERRYPKRKMTNMENKSIVVSKQNLEYVFLLDWNEKSCVYSVIVAEYHNKIVNIFTLLKNH